MSPLATPPPSTVAWRVRHPASARRDRRPTGIALQTTDPAAGTEPGALCARTTFTYLSWANRLSLTREPQTCQCLTGARAVCQ